MRSWFLVGLSLLASSGSYAGIRTPATRFGIALHRCSTRIANGSPHPELVNLMRKSKNRPEFSKKVLARLEANRFDLQRSLRNFYLGWPEHPVATLNPECRKPLHDLPAPNKEFSALGYFRKVFGAATGDVAATETTLDFLLERLWAGYPLLSEYLLVEMVEEDWNLFPKLQLRWQELVGEEAVEAPPTLLQWVFRGFPRAGK